METETSDFKLQYSALTCGVGVVVASDRTQLEFTGADRTKFLHNLCTNTVRDLPMGTGCETFILNVKGHIVGHGFVFICPASIVLETVPGQAEKLLAHFNRYLIREDVQVSDQSGDWAEFFLAGAQADECLTHLNWPRLTERLSHVAIAVDGGSVWLRKVDFAGPCGYLIACERRMSGNIKSLLVAKGAIPCGDQAFQAARIEFGTPFFGQDIGEENLPQEIDRDRLAISFTKGCYLGQETVARIDALGHVNRLLRGIKFAGAEIPARGTALFSAVESGSAQDAKNVGHVTSAYWSPRLQAPLALALASRTCASPGTRFRTPLGAAEIVTLPLIKP
ncbi:MAG TPA: glycine cleavage T C-terminal barrel domain-containing protein [Pirellulales bacterium]|jgi:folate-binding protein YgfZ|nr:glycine cleavage T C-terminal barrel domain-containing protein [Pirellulales bacterium]